MVRLQHTIKRTGRKVERFLLRLFRFKFREKGSRRFHTCIIVRNVIGGDFLLCFGLFPRFFFRYGRSGFYIRAVHPLFLLMFRSQPSKLLSPFRCQTHHHLVKAVDGRIGFPVQCGINIVRVTLFNGFLRLCFLVPVYSFGGFNRRYSRNLRLGIRYSSFCRISFLRRLFLFDRFFYGHSPKVKQGELHGCRVILLAWLYFRFFLYRLCLRFIHVDFFCPRRRYRFQLCSLGFHLCFNGKPFPYLPDCARIQAHGKPEMTVLVKHTAQIPGDACGFALVQIDHSGLAVRVGIEFCGRMHDTFGMVDEIGVVRQVCLRIRLYHGQ